MSAVITGDNTISLRRIIDAAASIICTKPLIWFGQFMHAVDVSHHRNHAFSFPPAPPVATIWQR
ncbi:MAG: hypothetical protein ACNA8L_12540 [Luteolibacter sp.]